MTLLKLDALSRRFGATRALDGVSLSIAAGEIVALMGANGAGKSTLVNIVSGTLPPDSGTIVWRGTAFAPTSPADATRAGIVTVHQSTDRVGAAGLTVADTLLLPGFATGSTDFFLSRRTVRAAARRILDKAGFELPLDADFGDLRAADRQLVAIARAIAADAALLILDEPTASLSGPESIRLYSVLKRLRGEGMAILYISHRIADLQALADRVVIMRGGRIAAIQSRPIDFTQAVAAMIGRPVDAARPDRRAPDDSPVFTARRWTLLPGTPPIDLDLHRGEVVAISGPLGSGKSRLLASIFGAQPAAGGTLALAGRPYLPTTPAAAIAAGIAYAGEDRHRTSLLPSGWPGADLAGTIALPHLARWFPHGALSRTIEQRAAATAILDLGIKASGPFAPMATLSGGNQQKAVLARWHAEPFDLVLLDEPFQGVDVGARADIIAAIRRHTAAATLIATSDPEEAAAVADRIFTMDRHGLVQHHAFDPGVPEKALA